MARAAGAEPWAAPDGARDLAGTLLAGGGREDRRRAIALLDEGLGAAARLGMHGVAKSILGLKLEAQGASRRAAGATAITAV